MVADMNQKTFGIDLCRARESKGMGGSGLADKIGVSANSIHKWENGLSFPRPDKWKAIEFETGIKPQDYDSKKPYYAKRTVASEVVSSTLEMANHNLATNEAVEMLNEVLASPTIYKAALIASVRAFHKATLGEFRMGKMEEEMAELKKNQFKMMEMMEEFFRGGGSKREIPATGQ